MVVLPTEKRFDWKYPPVMLFFIVFVNVIVFFFYQTNDSQKYYKALVHYVQSDLITAEWPAFQLYLREKGDSDLLEKYQKQFSQQYADEIVAAIVRDKEFYLYLEEHDERLVLTETFQGDSRAAWQQQRLRVNELFNSISLFQFGLIPSDRTPLTFFSHQFLHGGFGHLLGNMFFLVFCGFAVEAAIGGWLFLGLYLASGLLGGLAFTLFNLQGGAPLVGASGAISGVMAMYLGVFRLRKIEFFYWVFIFAGYFRAPALLILPFYIGKELLDFFYNTNSNVAFMAHAGGFIGGSILLALIYWLKPGAVNQDYVEENQDVDPQRESLARIYALVDKFYFDKAIKESTQFLDRYGDNFDINLLRYNLSRNQGGDVQRRCLVDLIAINPNSKQQLNRLAQAWGESGDFHEKMNPGALMKLAMKLTTAEHVHLAEAIFKRVYKPDKVDAGSGMLARKLSIVFDKLKKQRKKQYYETIADECITGAL